jgi:S-DNA-T family DNA segregation ATPase FtsK/SpoIIIE
MYAAGWRPDMLDAPGKFLISTPEYAAPRPARAYLMTDADVEQTAARYADSRPIRTAPVAPVLHLPRADASEPDRALTDALDRAPAQGISVPELIATTGRSRRWIYYRLRELAAEGRAEQTERGAWRSIANNSQ